MRYFRAMVFVSLTRLRLRSVRFVPGFMLHASRSTRQIKQAAGFQAGAVLADRQWTFWTISAWDSGESMRRYMTTGGHKQAMPKLIEWCDEASVAHWEQDEATLPTWIEADQRMRSMGRISKVRYPSPQHAELAVSRAENDAGRHDLAGNAAWKRRRVS